MTLHQGVWARAALIVCVACSAWIPTWPQLARGDSLPAGLPAEATATVLDRAGVLRYVKASTPTLKVAFADIAVAKAGTVGVGALSLSNPSVTVTAGPRFGTPILGQVAVSLVVPVDLAGRPSARIEVASAAVGLSEAQADEIRRQTAREALLRYVRVLRAQAEVDNATARRALTATVLAISKRRLSTDDVGTGDVAVAELEHAREEARLAAAKGIAASRSILLTSYVGAPETSKVVGELLPTDAPPALDSILASLSKRADLRVADAARTSASAGLKLAKADVWPTFGLVGNYEYQAGSLVTFGVVVPLPFFNSNKTAVSISSARIAASNTEWDALHARAVGEVKAAYATQVAARGVVDALANITRLSESAIARTTKAYEAGVSGLLDVLLVRRTATEAVKEKLDADLALAEARIELDAAAGRLP